MPASMNLSLDNSRRSFLGFIIVFLFCGFMVGWGNSWQSVRKQSEKVRCLQADFIQKKSLAILSEPLISKGKIFFKAPDSLRLEYTSPVRSITLVHENDYKSYTQNDDGLTRDSDAQLSVMRPVINEISLWFQGRFKESSHFEATLKPEKQIILTPKNKAIKSAVELIKLHLSQKPGLLNKVVIVENEKSRTELIFKNASLNCSFNASLFQKASSF